MTMPNLGGRDVLQRLRETATLVPTVAMSGNFERQDLAFLRELGVATLPKPFHRDDLVRSAWARCGSCGHRISGFAKGRAAPAGC
jgi:CheY-like chemotaxis protein